MQAKVAQENIQPTDLVITNALWQRSQRAPDLRAEVAAFCELSAILTVDPRRAVHRFLQLALRLCNAGTSGLSILRTNSSGESSFHWDALSGALVACEGFSMPRHFSPSGLCLDAGRTILVSRPEHVFTYLRANSPSITEALIVPLYDTAKKPLGTIWIAHHDATAWFCANDARVIEQLATNLVLALKILDDAQEFRYTLASLQSSHNTEQQAIAQRLAEERDRRERAETSETGIREALVFKNAVIQEVDHRAKNTVQIAANLLLLQARADSSDEVRKALHEGYRRLHVLAKVHELLYMSEHRHGIFMSRLLNALSDALRQSFADMAAHVTLKVTCEEILLSDDDAIPMALLANEIVTNAYKHAFPAGSSGTIAIDLRRGLENAVILSITDDGVGMQGHGGESSLGQKLMRSFAKHLKGTLVCGARDGTGTSISVTICRPVMQEETMRTDGYNEYSIDRARPNPEVELATVHPFEPVSTTDELTFSRHV